MRCSYSLVFVVVVRQRINVREKIVGFYSTGPLIKPSDLDIADLVSNYCKKPVFALIDIRADREEEGLPVKAYTTIEKVRCPPLCFCR